MAGFASAGMKRKNIEELPDARLFSPATKALRLDVNFFPSMEEEPAIPLVFEQELPKQQINGITQVGFVMTETMPSIMPDFSSNEERSLVLYNPVNDSSLVPSSPSNFPLTVDSDLIAALKSGAFWPGNPNPTNIERRPIDDRQSVYNNLAIVQWVPSPAPATTCGIGDSGSRSEQLEEPMETEGALMEVSEETEHTATNGINTEGFQQWQQHCVTPVLLPSTSAPMMWSW